MVCRSANRFLVFSGEEPRPITGGGTLLTEIVHHLATLGSVCVVFPRPTRQFDQLINFGSDAARVTLVELLPRKSTLLNTVKRVASLNLSMVTQFNSKENSRQIHRVLDSFQATKMVIVSSAACSLVSKLAPQVIRDARLYLFDYEPDLYENHLSGIRNKLRANLEKIRSLSSVKHSISSCRQVGTVSYRDLEKLRALNPNATNMNVVAPIMRPRDHLKQSNGRKRFAILPTNYQFPPNRRSLDWFFRAVLPHVSPELQIVITGQDDHVKSLSALCSKAPNVSFMGLLERREFEALISQSAFAINPTICGSGFQIKLLDAIASGVPVVSTTFSNPFGDRIASSDDAEIFATLINEFGRDAARQFDYQAFFSNAKDEWAKFLGLAQE